MTIPEDAHILDPLDPSSGREGTVAVAMSGGVDSSVAAALLSGAGYDVTGFTMCLGDATEPETGGCAHGTGVAERAREVADFLGIGHHTIHLHQVFDAAVVDPFVHAYLEGRTPNPCVNCNMLIKWGALFRHARRMGCDCFATGHYARIARFADGTHSLCKGGDAAKDQSYFLWRLTDGMLSRTLFPLGGMTKKKVQSLARKRSLPIRTTEESQEICFVPGDDYRAFLRRRRKNGSDGTLAEGNIITADGTVVGRHAGAAFYTIGQRRGLGVALGHPVYVTAIDPVSNTVTVGNDADLSRRRMELVSVLWQREAIPAGPVSAAVKIRYRHHGAPAEIMPDGGAAQVTFDHPQRAVTPGQSAVFYRGDLLLGGGIIAGALP